MVLHSKKPEQWQKNHVGRSARANRGASDMLGHFQASGDSTDCSLGNPGCAAATNVHPGEVRTRHAAEAATAAHAAHSAHSAHAHAHAADMDADARRQPARVLHAIARNIQGVVTNTSKSQKETAGHAMDVIARRQPAHSLHAVVAEQAIGQESWQLHRDETFTDTHRKLRKAKPPPLPSHGRPYPVAWCTKL